MRSPSLVRLIVGYGTIACALPYLVLKAIWVTGGQLGVADAAMMRDGSMIALNLATACMDLVGIALALAFTHAWGLHLPAWLVLPPAWVAMGLLSRFVVAVPVTALAGLLTFRTTPPTTGGPVHAWVYALVYMEFVGLGIGLTLAFVLYAHARWSWAFRSTMETFGRGATYGVQAPLSTIAAAMAIGVGVIHLAWALGATIGLPNELVARRTLSSHLLNAIDGVMMLGGAAGVLMLVYRLGRDTSAWLPLAMAWIGSGFLFAWGLWGLINVLANTPLVRDRLSATPILNLIGLVQMLAGLVLGLVILFLLAERERQMGLVGAVPPSRSASADRSRTAPLRRSNTVNHE